MAFFCALAILTSTVECRQPEISELLGTLGLPEYRNANKGTLEQLLTDGEMDGYFKLSYFWDLYDELYKTYPNFVSKKVKIGSTIQKRDIHAFYIGSQVSKCLFL